MIIYVRVCYSGPIYLSCLCSTCTINNGNMIFDYIWSNKSQSAAFDTHFCHFWVVLLIKSLNNRVVQVKWQSVDSAALSCPISA